jgi:hypothetical protein
MGLVNEALRPELLPLIGNAAFEQRDNTSSSAK